MADDAKRAYGQTLRTEVAVDGKGPDVQLERLSRRELVYWC